MVRKLISYLIFIQIFLGLCCGSGIAREITDMTGRKVSVPDVIRKTYCTSPPVTYMTYAIDPDMIAALNAPYSGEATYVSERVRNLPVVGGWFGQGRTPNLETLMQVKPDIILAGTRQGAAMNQKIEQTLAPLGFPVVYIVMDTLDDYPAVFRFLGGLLARKIRAESLCTYTEQLLETVKKQGAEIPESEKVSVYYAQGADGLSTECRDSIHAELIPLCGGINVHSCKASHIYGMEKISLEQVIHYNPRVIVTREPVFYDSVLTDPRWQNIRAVRTRRIYNIPSSPFNWFDRPPSFMRLLGAKWLMRCLYPQRYPVNLVEETQKFYQLFLNINLDEQAARKILEP